MRCLLEGPLSLQLGAREELGDEKGWQLTSCTRCDYVCMQYRFVLPALPCGLIVCLWCEAQASLPLHTISLWTYSFCSLNCKKVTHSTVVSDMT